MHMILRTDLACPSPNSMLPAISWLAPHFCTARHARKNPTPSSNMQGASRLAPSTTALSHRLACPNADPVDGLQGAIARLAPNATAFPHRLSRLNLQYYVRLENVRERQAALTWQRQTRARVRPAVRLPVIDVRMWHTSSVAPRVTLHWRQLVDKTKQRIFALWLQHVRLEHWQHMEVALLAC